MRLALISDLHANRVALDAVLDDIERRGVDRTICLGDVATLGPEPSYVLAKLKALGCLCIEGNHEAFLKDFELIHSYTEAPIVVDAVKWCQERLSEEELAFLHTFKSSAEIALEGEHRLLVYHGSPRSHTENLLADTNAEALDEALAGTEAEIYAGGHTHLQMLRQHRGAWVVNPGSVGLPFKEFVFGKAPVILPHAEYATITSEGSQLSVELHRLALDRQAMREANEASDNPLSAALLEVY